MTSAAATRGLSLTRRSALFGIAAAGGVLAAPSVLRGEAPRIVTIGSGVTETVFALGRGHDVVAVDAASLYPRAAARLPKVSYPKLLSAEEVRLSRPDIVLVADEAGPAGALGEIARGSAFLRLPEARRPDDVAAGLRLIATALGEQARGEALADLVSADFAAVDDGLRAVTTRRRALVLLGAPDGRMLIAAGRGSPAAIALGFAGAENAAATVSGWTWMAPAAARDLDPDAFVALSGASAASPETVLAAPVARGTSAGRDRRVAVVDGSAFTGFGPRSGLAVRQVASRIYPEANFSPAPSRLSSEPEIAGL